MIKTLSFCLGSKQNKTKQLTNLQCSVKMTTKKIRRETKRGDITQKNSMENADYFHQFLFLIHY